MHQYINTRFIPSYLGSRESGFVQDDGTFSTVQLMQGEVKKVTYPGDRLSESKHCVEYQVDAEYRDGGGATSTVTFPNCRVMNSFGGMADHSRYTLRVDSGSSSGDAVFGNGSKVLLLCLLGGRSRAYIIGGIRDDEDGKEIDKASDGHNYYWEFNGVSQRINKDGEYRLQFIGATQANGKLGKGVDPLASPTTLEITKDGSFEIYTKDRNQFLKFDHANKKVTFQAADEFDSTVGGKYISQIQDTADVSIGGNTTIGITGSLDVSASRRVSIKSAGVSIGAAGELFPMFTTYRAAEGVLHSALIAGLTAAAAGLSGAAAVPLLAPAAAQLSAAAAGLTAMATALGVFEGQAATFFSKKNRND